MLWSNVMRGQLKLKIKWKNVLQLFVWWMKEREVEFGILFDGLRAKYLHLPRTFFPFFCAGNSLGHWVIKQIRCTPLPPFSLSLSLFLSRSAHCLETNSQSSMSNVIPLSIPSPLALIMPLSGSDEPRAWRWLKILLSRVALLWDADLIEMRFKSEE